MFKTRGLSLALIFCALMAGMLVGRFSDRLRLMADGEEPDTSTLLMELQSLAHLVTVKYIIEKLVVFEDAKWYGENRVLLIASGVAKAGIDLSQLASEDLDVEEGRVVVRLPSPVITDVYLDESKTRVLEHSTGLLRQFDKTLEQRARRRATEEIERAALTGGIHEEASKQGKEQIRAFLGRLGFAEVEFCGE